MSDKIYPKEIGVMAYEDGAYEVDVHTPRLSPNVVYVRDDVYEAAKNENPWRYPKYDYGLPDVGEWVDVSIDCGSQQVVTIAAVRGFYETKHLTYEGDYAWRESTIPAPRLEEVSK